MTILLTILIILNLLMIAIQDFKNKLVSWFLFPIAFVLMIIYHYAHIDLINLATFFFINISIITFLMLVLLVYFRIKNGKWLNIFDKYIGLGDVLLFVVLSVAFSPMNFILFMILSLVLTLIIFAAGYLINKNVNRYVPLAGLFSVYFMVIFTCNVLLNKPEMLNDDQVINYLTKIIL